ncbi:MAG: hypothetical protein J6X89_08240 [Bacteroidales bacterium]|nr:hypothetical protein [Bacteroidales bacterium]
MITVALVAMMLLAARPAVQAETRWTINPETNAIVMDAAANAGHHDHIEMSGQRAAIVYYWGIDDAGRYYCEYHHVFPLLRMIPNNTHAFFPYRHTTNVAQMIKADGKTPDWKAVQVEIDGTLKVTEKADNLELSRVNFPSTTKQAIFEMFAVKNTSDKPVKLDVPDYKYTWESDPARGVKGSYVMDMELVNGGKTVLEPGDTRYFYLVMQAYEKNEAAERRIQPGTIAFPAEYAARMDLFKQLSDNLILDTPDEVINTEFRFAKLRASESIIATKGGLMHAPGGESYYAALWCNDQCEYVNPFFPFTGYDIGVKSAYDCYMQYSRFMNPEYEPIPSSIIAEGDDIWNGAGDRGDAAMTAYGASRYCLECADKKVAEDIWPLIEWCLEYCRLKQNAQGVVESDHDELEGRFEDGDANLCTSTLYYDALQSASYLAKELGKSGKMVRGYRRQAKQMRRNICNFFEANVGGYDTYRYYDGNDTLRSWICMPLVVGIFDRADATLDALFESELYTGEGLLTQMGEETYWDRSTLYAFRGAYYAGKGGYITPKVSAYSHRRLLEDHVPYPIEAWPEGRQRHLSAESGLYCRIFTEGMFGIRPIGFRSFTMKPSFPDEWNQISLKKVRAFGGDFDISCERKGKRIITIITNNNTGQVKVYNKRQGKVFRVNV